MKKSRFLIYGLIVVGYFILLHIFFPPWLNSSIKNAIDRLFMNFFSNWMLIFPFIGLSVIIALMTLLGIHFLASFGSGYKSKKPFISNITVLIASKNERPLLERTLNSIVESGYPKEKLQIISIISGSTDDSEAFCRNFGKQHSDIDLEVLSEPIPKRGKPAALNYGLKSVKHEICIFYDSGVVVTKNTLQRLINPLQYDKHDVTIGPVVIENWKQNKWTRGVTLDYTFSGAGGIFFDVKNRLGSSAYLFGRNFCIRTDLLKQLGGFNENSLTEDLYLTVLLNLNEKKILFVPKAKAYDLAPFKISIIKKQRQRWVGGYIGDANQLMKMEKGNKSGQSIIISRNLSMLFLHHMDDWILVIIGFVIFYSIVGFYYLLSWALSSLVFSYGYLFNAIRKFGDKHYSCLILGLPFCAYIHFYMLKLQVSLPEIISWEKTPMILERNKEEIELLATIKS